MEVLLAYTWEPAAASAISPGAVPLPGVPGPLAGGPIGPALANQLAQVRNGRALVDLLCNGNLACEGRLDLLQRGRYAEPAARKKKKKPTGYGKASYSIPAGGRRP